MRQRARQLLVCISLLLVAACGNQSEETGIRVSQAERVLGPNYESVVHDSAAQALYVDPTSEDSAHKQFVRDLVDEKVRMEMERVAAEEAQHAADVQAEQDRMAAEKAAEAKRVAAEEAQAAKRARAAVTATSTTIAHVFVDETPSGSGRCGGQLPPCYVMKRESGGNPRAYNATGCYNKKDGTSGCYGKWQFMDATWQGLGYSGHAYDYAESVQDEGALTLWDGGRGCSHWNAC